MEQGIQPLNPIAIDLGPIQVHWYGLIIGFGVLLGLIIALRESERRGLDKEIFTDLILFAVPIAIISARIYYVIFQWEYYSQNPGDIIKIWNGGIAIHGALIGSVLTAIVFAKVKKVSFWKLVDIAAPSLLLGQAIGRWGNFMNQEAHGGEITRSFLENMHLPEFIINQMYINGTYYHPTFLYESIWNILGVIILLSLRKVNLRRGELFLTYVIWYSIGRYYIEGLRTDSLMLTESLRIAQVISIVLIAVAIALVVYRRVRGHADKRYLDA
ncbi:MULTISPECIES: prolipoprotein diacylglyceryl transferase [Peribacillus]|jgi:phosphatidylglycerol:prolipoprotein diacylglycerol transferase|uniref:Phosphatidylglycerol--prolipoprotein diacylglyceryl transferase n=1 Tax=Peribacillus castrilensis TaxID=2897690 RepID=A0AAW9N5X5_9BACI|nr:prolipoprotein diacylglyceryl transferase [Peribacillus frigoritolerans]KOR81016.1 diacylglyceryl transferase [Bacillus sp. FJAT-21352]MEC0271783.1 prolipoprotein diacylglyceryl transferase [Peribacillus castrilensis]MCY9138697.1 prolipoprotein diacylglyceryl transferase [Peribacillus frigoritolerans]MDM5308936.1 prolipoprotein diacylglyceryl transferase [Peribacillus frigoritolerans]MEC0296951.1 prolipoprotein diacylglyceryl transferase [Peribacillus castrilensis]